MTSLAASVDGVATVEASVAAVVAAVQDPATLAAVVELVAAESAPHVPVDTGRLAGSRQTTGSRLVWAAPYAVIVHARQPWLGAGITAAVPRIVDLYETRVTQAWG